MATTRKKKCPSCGTPLPASITEANDLYPFCSRRCQLIDLGHWFDGDYAIPVQPPEEFAIDSENDPSEPPGDSAP